QGEGTRPGAGSLASEATAHHRSTPDRTGGLSRRFVRPRPRDIEPTRNTMARQHPPTVLFAAGGTGGHIYPAIAVADALTEMVPDFRAVFVGTAHGLENEIVPRAGYPLELIDVRFLKGVSTLKKIKHAALLPRAAWQSWRLLRRYQPRLVLGAGGYASGPVTGIAALTRRPTAILEQNAIPGLTNRMLGRFVDRIF